MNDSSLFDKLVSLARDKYNNGDPAHDFAHILRVIETCRRLGSAEGADLDILLPAALLHDVVNLPKDHPERHRGSEFAAEEGARLMRLAGYNEETIAQTKIAILQHSFSAGHRASTPEAAILQDADRLDALGAIGTMRMLTVGAKLGRIFYDSEDPLAERRSPDDKRFTIDHFQTKLFLLADKMNTAAGRAEGRRRTEFMRNFVSQLNEEIQS